MRPGFFRGSLLVPPTRPGGASRLGPMLGHVGSNDARIWVKASEASRLGVWIGQEADLADAKRVEGPMLDKTEDCNGHIRVDGLNHRRGIIMPCFWMGNP